MRQEGGETRMKTGNFEWFFKLDKIYITYNKMHDSIFLNILCFFGLWPPLTLRPMVIWDTEWRLTLDRCHVRRSSRWRKNLYKVTEWVSYDWYTGPSAEAQFGRTFMSLQNCASALGSVSSSGWSWCFHCCLFVRDLSCLAPNSNTVSHYNGAGSAILILKLQ